MLVDAYDNMVAETSTTTGQPVWITRSGDPSISFRVDEMIDFGDAALKEWDDKEMERKPKRHGVIRFLVPTVLGDAPVPEGGIERARLVQAMREQARGAEDRLLPGSTLDPALIDFKKPAGGYDLSEYG